MSQEQFPDANGSLVADDVTLLCLMRVVRLRVVVTKARKRRARVEVTHRAVAAAHDRQLDLLVQHVVAAAQDHRAVTRAAAQRTDNALVTGGNLHAMGASNASTTASQRD